MLSTELANETSQLHIRNAAALALKNALSARVRKRVVSLPSGVFTSFIQEATRQTEFANRWLAFDAVAKNKIKQETLVTLASPVAKAGSFAAQVVAAIATVELPHDQWPDLIELLLGFVNNSTNTNLRIATLQTIGYICESIVRRLIDVCLITSLFLQKPEILSLRSNEILTAVIHGARKDEPSSDVQLAAVHALYNSLEFVRDNFDREVCHVKFVALAPLKRSTGRA